MRILQIGKHYMGWFNALRAAGHELLVLPYWQWFSTGNGNDYTGTWEMEGKGLSPEEVNRLCVERAMEFKPDLLIQFKGWMDGKRKIWPETIRKIKAQTGCLTAYWSVDDPDFTPFWATQLGGNHWDIALTCSRSSVREYLVNGVADPNYFLPAFDVGWGVLDREVWGFPSEGSPVVEREAVDLVVIGHPYTHPVACDMGRAEFALAALRAGFSVEIYGPGQDAWVTDIKGRERDNPPRRPTNISGRPELVSCYKGLLPYDEVWRACLRGKVVLNNHLRQCAVGYEPRVYEGYTNDKVPLIAGCGTVMLMDHQPGMSPGVLEAGKEYLEYSPSLDEGECIRSALSLLGEAVNNDDMRREIGQAAQARVFREHTWQHRVAQLEAICADHQ